MPLIADLFQRAEDTSPLAERIMKAQELQKQIDFDAQKRAQMIKQWEQQDVESGLRTRRSEQQLEAGQIGIDDARASQEAQAEQQRMSDIYGGKGYDITPTEIPGVMGYQEQGPISPEAMKKGYVAKGPKGGFREFESLESPKEEYRQKLSEMYSKSARSSTSPQAIGIAKAKYGEMQKRLDGELESLYRDTTGFSVPSGESITLNAIVEEAGKTGKLEDPAFVARIEAVTQMQEGVKASWQDYDNMSRAYQQGQPYALPGTGRAKPMAGAYGGGPSQQPEQPQAGQQEPSLMDRPIAPAIGDVKFPTFAEATDTSRIKAEHNKASFEKKLKKKKTKALHGSHEAKVGRIRQGKASNDDKKEIPPSVKFLSAGLRVILESSESKDTPYLFGTGKATKSKSGVAVSGEDIQNEIEEIESKRKEFGDRRVGFEKDTGLLFNTLSWGGRKSYSSVNFHNQEYKQAFNRIIATAKETPSMFTRQEQLALNRILKDAAPLLSKEGTSKQKTYERGVIPYLERRSRDVSEGVKSISDYFTR